MDCTPTCRLPKHAELILSAVTREDLPTFQSAAKRICSNPSNVTDGLGRHPLLVAASCGKGDILEWLVEECKVDLGLRDLESGWTALHRSLYYGYLGCAVSLIKHGADLYAFDKEDLTPLDLVMLDSPYKMSTSVEARVVSNYKTLLDDELELDVGDVIQNVHQMFNYKNYWMGSLKGKRGFFPKDFVELIKHGYRTELYTWGANTNFTLGHCDESMRQNPELVDALSSDHTINIKQVVMCKFHSVFLSEDGRVFTCGHGRGGRLGHGDEKTQLAPQQVQGLKDGKCINIAAAQDHTVVVLESGVVFTFGLNDMQQLGHSPALAQCLVPKMVQVKAWKGKGVIGVAAGQYHTVFYTITEVYTCGLNIGQLGHIKGDKFQTTPRQVSALHHKDIQIAMVTCSDAATVCASVKGDIYVLSQYTCQKVVNRFSELTRLLVSGGKVDLNSNHEVSRVYDKITLTLLNARGLVYQWKAAYGGIRKCKWSLRRELTVADIAIGKHLFVITDRGEAFACSKSDEHINLSKRDRSSSSSSLGQLSEDWDRKDTIGYSVSRLPMVHRGISIFTDVKSRGFAVLQVDPLTGLDERPEVSSSRMCEDFKQLFEEMTSDDNIHDVLLMVNMHVVPAHSFILASRSQTFCDLLTARKEENSKHENGTARLIKLEKVKDCKALTTYLQDLYSGVSVDDSAVFVDETIHKRKDNAVKHMSENPHQTNGTLDDNLENIDPLLLNFEGFASQDLDDFSTPTSVDDAGAFLDENESSLGRKKHSKTKKKLEYVEKKTTNGCLTYRSRQNTGLQKISRRCFRFSRKSCPELHDVTIESEDGVKFPCHKCVLVARLDYFRSMLGCGWLEASTEMKELRMPIHSSVLQVVLDYLYTDEAKRIEGCKDVEFIGNVLVVADQLLIARLAEICESVMAKLIASKNVMELLEFSCVYNAYQLKAACLEFICSNLNNLLEAGHLSLLSEETLEEVSKAYRKAIPNMPWRVITPQDDHLAAMIHDPHPSPSKKRRSSSRKRSVKSESEGDSESVLTELEENKSVDRRTSDLLLEDVFEGDVFVGSLGSGKELGASSPESTELDSPRACDVTEVIALEPIDEGMWYRKESEEDTKQTSKLKTSGGKSQGEKMTKSPATSTPKDIPTIQNSSSQIHESHRKAWGTILSTSSPPSTNLRTIMEQEQKGDSTRSPGTRQNTPTKHPTAATNKSNEVESPFQAHLAVKWETGVRQSQKQRKKAKSSPSGETTRTDSPGKDSNDTRQTADTSSTEPKPNPWGLVATKPMPVRSLRELIEQEKKKQCFPKPGLGPTTRNTAKTTPAKDKQNNTRKTLGWELQSRGREHEELQKEKEKDAKPISPRNAWQSPAQDASSPPSTSVLFADILHSQEQENTNLDRARMKPLSQIQLEDRAIQQLLEHYGGRDNACEFVTVERIPAAIATPVWNRDRSTSAVSS